MLPFWVLFPFVYQLSHSVCVVYFLTPVCFFILFQITTTRPISARKNSAQPVRHSRNVPLADIFPLSLLPKQEQDIQQPLWCSTFLAREEVCVTVSCVSPHP